MRNFQLMQPYSSSDRSSIGFPPRNVVDRCIGARGTGTITLIYTCTLHLKYVVLRSGAGNDDDLGKSQDHRDHVSHKNQNQGKIQCATLNAFQKLSLSYQNNLHQSFSPISRLHILKFVTSLFTRSFGGNVPIVSTPPTIHLSLARQCIEHYPNVVLFEQCPRCQ